MRATTRIEPLPGQESVWDYPRPPRLEPSTRRVRVTHAGVVVADSIRAMRVLETSHPPSWYVPPQDVHLELLTGTSRTTVCEWKGQATYWTLRVGGLESIDVAWSYPSPSPAFTAITDYFAFYPGRVDACYVDEEPVIAQPGGFYGGWITSDVVGPFKGDAGTGGW